MESSILKTEQQPHTRKLEFKDRQIVNNIENARL